MATKRVAKGVKKIAQVKVDHPPYLTTNIPAGKAAPAPPLGPQIGQRGGQIGVFVKQFNEMTKEHKPGIPVPTHIKFNPDRTFDIVLYSPSTAYFLMKAAGMRKGSPRAKEIMGKVSLKHVYEIAQIKSKDPPFRNVPLKEICKQIIGTSHSLGIEVVKHLDPEEYGKFIVERNIKDEEHERELEEIRQAKLLRL